MQNDTSKPESNTASGRSAVTGRHRRNSSNFNLNHQKSQNQPQHPPVFSEPLKESKYLEYLMREKYHLYEDQEQQKVRRDAIKRLETVANEWALALAIKKGANEEEERSKSQVEAIVFGSYMLNVHCPGTDVDVILVFKQKYVSQKEFLHGFVKHVQGLDDFSDLLSIS